MFSMKLKISVLFSSDGKWIHSRDGANLISVGREESEQRGFGRKRRK